MTTRALRTKVDPEDSAQHAGLRYVRANAPGIRRVRSGKSFQYKLPSGKPLRDARDLERIRALAIPPAWKEVWICTHPNGHLQASGTDARGRKQYRYHPQWRAVRDVTKFERMIAFGQALPRLRRRTDRDISRKGLPREKVLATVVQLLEKTLIRVGNLEYARSNQSYGLTTFRDKHVSARAGKLRFTFAGKSNVQHAVDIHSRRLAQVVKRCRDLPGQQLFQYVDETGIQRDVNSADVNLYLQEVTGEPFTAKDFRTWAGTLLAAGALQEFGDANSKAKRTKNVIAAIEQVAERLGNTRAVCRKCYIHPAVIEAYLEGTLAKTLRRGIKQELKVRVKLLPKEEQKLLAFLYGRLAQDAKRA